MRDLKDVIGKLAEMSPDDMAAHFREHGIAGLRAHAKTCVVARYITQETSITSVGVTRKYIRAYNDDGYIRAYINDGIDSMFVTPPSVEEFVTRFDAGKYPHLVELETDSGKDNEQFVERMFKLEDGK